MAALNERYEEKSSGDTYRVIGAGFGMVELEDDRGVYIHLTDQQLKEHFKKRY